MDPPSGTQPLLKDHSLHLLCCIWSSQGFIITAGVYSIITFQLKAFTLQMDISLTPVAFIEPPTVINIQASLVNWLVHLKWT